MQIPVRPLYRGVILEIKEREEIFDVLVEVSGSEPLVGQIVLEALDFVVDDHKNGYTKSEITRYADG